MLSITPNTSHRIIPQYGTIQHNTTQHNTTQHSTAQHSTRRHTTTKQGGATHRYATPLTTHQPITLHHRAPITYARISAKSCCQPPHLDNVPSHPLSLLLLQHVHALLECIVVSSQCGGEMVCCLVMGVVVLDLMSQPIGMKEETEAEAEVEADEAEEEG
ncbi:hypothetical protein TcWFU_008714 [Taenia crassiceps]|uniref:Uncharacterized protein n=1 Tax=Taenia crassiceps TaxID=6207 RepID=A0ABR4Q8U5_9CEST